jgi:hypothetical protein
MRWMWLEKSVTTMRPVALRKISDKLDLISRFGQGEALALGIGGVGEQQHHALFGKGLDGRQIRGMAVEGGAVDLEVAGVDDAAGRGFDAEAIAVDDGMAHRKKGDGEIPERQGLAAVDRYELGEFLEAVLFQFLGGQGQGEFRPVKRRVAGPHEPGQGADVVLVPVGEDDAFEFVLVGQNEIEARDDHVDAEQGIVGKHQAAVHHDHGVSRHHGQAVEADFAEPAQGVKGHGRLGIHCRVSW